MDIVCTGEGLLSALGTGTAATVAALRRQQRVLHGSRHLATRHTSLPVGEVPLSATAMKEQLAIDEDNEVSRTVLMALLAIKEALSSAHLSAEEAHCCRVALVNGTTVGGMDRTEQHFKDIATAEDIDFLRHHTCGSTTQQIADYFGFFSALSTVSTACSSAANAMVIAANMLAGDEADIVIAGGSEALTLFHLNGFRSLLIVDAAPCRPFDASRAGLNLGEGAAYVVMERAEHAAARGAAVHGHLTGYGNACDAYHQTAFSDDGEGAYRAMCEALAMAQLSPRDIQYINAHGTGTENNDRSESIALRRVFGTDMPLVSSTKGYTGHATSAAGGIEVVLCLLALAHNFVPGNIGFSHPFAEGIVPTLGADAVPLTNIMCNSFGFGGNDTSLILSRAATTGGVPAIRGTEEIKVVARREFTADMSLAALTDYVSPLSARRMCRLMKASLLTSLQALADAGLSCPDAIIESTRFGCIDNSEHLLQQMIAEDEALLKPTLFMQSTHNTISGNIAIATRCHGYNCTFCDDDDPLSAALSDARRLLRTGRYSSVLVGCHDEATPLFATLWQRLGHPAPPRLHSVAMVLTRGDA